MAELAGQATSLAVSTIVNVAFASSIKSDQKKLEKLLSELDQKKQQELLELVQRTSTELERQSAVFNFINAAKREELENQRRKKNRFIYIGIGLGVLAYILMILKLKKK
jgi:Flp pilus assembly protein TadB